MGSTPRGISASRGAAILGLSEFQTPFEAWQTLMEEREPGFNASHGYVLPERKDSAPLRWGTAFEDAVVALAEEVQGHDIIHRERFACVPSFPEVTCHIDGAYERDPVDLGIVLHEGKTSSAFPFREKWGEPGTDRVPTYIAVQTQHQMLCMAAMLDIVSVLVFPETPEHWEGMGWTVEDHGETGWWLWNTQKSKTNTVMAWARVLQQMGYFHQYPVPANPDAQKGLIEAYKHFWHKHVLEAREPEPRTYDDIKRLVPEPKGTLVCPEGPASWFAELKAIGEEIGGGGPLAKRADAVKLQILSWARGQDTTIDDESRTATIFRDEAGKKLGQFSKNKNGVLIFRAS